MERCVYITMALRWRWRTAYSKFEIHDQSCSSPAPSTDRAMADPSSLAYRASTLSLPAARKTICHSVDGADTGCEGVYASASRTCGGSHRYSSAHGETISRHIGVSGERKTRPRKASASSSDGNGQTNVRVCRGRGKILKLALVITASEP